VVAVVAEDAHLSGDPWVAYARLAELDDARQVGHDVLDVGPGPRHLGHLLDDAVHGHPQGLELEEGILAGYVEAPLAVRLYEQLGATLDEQVADVVDVFVAERLSEAA